MAKLITHEGLKNKGIALGKLQLWRLERDNKFPKRVQTSPGRHAWVESEIDAYIEKKIAERDLVPPPRPPSRRPTNQLPLPLQQECEEPAEGSRHG